MSRWSKRIKQYERHILLGLVILLLVSFSVVGAVQCGTEAVESRDWSGSFEAAPGRKVTVSGQAFVETVKRYDAFRYNLSTPSLRYAAFFLREAQARGLPAAWAHIVATEAARSAGYRCGEDYQLPLTIRQAIADRSGGAVFTDALYDRFLRDFYRGSAVDFQQIVREIVLKDQFLRPLVESTRLGVTYAEAYEAWKGGNEEVDLRFVSLRGRDFALAARQVEATRETVGTQSKRLQSYERALRSVESLSQRIEAWQREHAGQAPASLVEVVGDALPKDAWDRPLVLAEGNGAQGVSSLGADGQPGTADDVGAAAVREVRTLAALYRVGDALQRWRKATEAWPETLARLLEAPTPQALPPLTQEEKDGWDRPLAYAPGADGAAPRLASAGPDGEAGSADDLAVVFEDERMVVSPGAATAPYVDAAAKDAWERPLRVRLADAALRAFAVTSAGPDGVWGNDDDVRSGNEGDLKAFYEQPEIQGEYQRPERRRFRALYVHLPLVPDAVLRRMWEAFPQHHPDERAAFERWRTYSGDDTYYTAEDPADPENGHGVALARRLAPGRGAVPVPDRTIFGEAPADLVPQDSPDHVAYLERGWRAVLLREEFFERVLADGLQQARESAQAHARWSTAKAAYDRGEGTDPGAEPVVVTFETLLAGPWAPYVPGETDAPYLGFYETAELIDRVTWEANPSLGDINLTVAGLAPLAQPEQYAAIPTNLHDAQTKAILQGLEVDPEHPADLAEVREEVFERYVARRALDLAADALEGLRGRLEEAGRTATVPPGGAESPAPVDQDAAAVWTREVEAWAGSKGLAPTQGATGWFIGPQPPAASKPPPDASAEAVYAARQRDFVRQTGYETVRSPGESEAGGAPPGTLGRRTLRDEVKDGTDAVYLAQVVDRRFPPPAAFAPRQYAFEVLVRVYGDLFGQGRRRGVEEPPRGDLPLALWRHYLDFPAIKRAYGLTTGVDVTAEPR